MPDLELVTFDRLAGAEVRYARPPVAPYGTRGKGPRRQRLAPGFRELLERTLAELWELHPWGPAEAIVSAGAYVAKAGRHAQGRAYDIDALWWPDGRRLVTLDAPTCWPHYLAIEAVLRRHFGTVLGHTYNRAHHDHWHVDDGSPVRWDPRSRSRVAFLQAALVHVWGQSLAVDGVWGPASRAACEAALGRDTGETWPDVLLATARRGFELV